MDTFVTFVHFFKIECQKTNTDLKKILNNKLQIEIQSARTQKKVYIWSNRCSLFMSRIKCIRHICNTAHLFWSPFYCLKCIFAKRFVNFWLQKNTNVKWYSTHTWNKMLKLTQNMAYMAPQKLVNHLTFLKRNLYSVDVQQPCQLVLNSFMDMDKIKFLLKLVNYYTRRMTSSGYLCEHLIGKETNFVYLYKKKLFLKGDTLLVSVAKKGS